MGIPLQYGVLPNNVYAKYRSYKNCGRKLRGKRLDGLVVNKKKNFKYLGSFRKRGSVVDRTRTCGRYALTEDKLVVIDGTLQTFTRKQVAGFAPQMNMSTVTAYTETKRHLLHSRKLRFMKFTYNEVGLGWHSG
jgi:predicted kinase